MQTVKLALRNLLRNGRRTLSTLSAIIVGAVGILLFGGYNHSIEYSLQTTFVRDIGHLQIQHKDYLQQGTGNPMEYSVQNYQKIMDIIAEDPVLKPMVKVSTPILLMSGIASNYAAGTSRPVLMYGSESVSQQQLSLWDDYNLGNGLKVRKILDKNVPSGALIGGGLSRLLQLCDPAENASCDTVKEQQDNSAESLPADLMQLAQDTREVRVAEAGQHIELLAASAGGAPNIVRVQVIGSQAQPARELDDSYVGIHLKQAQQLLFGRAEPGVTAIVLQLNHTDQTEAARQQLQNLFATTLAGEPLTVLDFTELQPLYNQILEMFGKLFKFFLVLILCIALFTIGNTMGMAVIERTVEIGTLRAIGLKQRDIQQLFLTEGMLLGVIGSVLGVISALILAYIINRSGLTWQPPGVIAPIPIRISVWGEWLMIISVMCTLMVATVFSSWWPSRRAANVSIVQALRHA